MRMRMEEKYVKRRTVLEVLAMQGLGMFFVSMFFVWLLR